MRDPRYVVDQGKTPVLTGAQVRQLLDSIPTTNVVGLRGRAPRAIQAGAVAPGRRGICLCSRTRLHFVMGKIRRGGFLFVWWIGDHAPRHVHVYRDGKRVCTWNLDAGEVMGGEASRKIRKLIAALLAEGKL